VVTRGDVWLARLDPTEGREIRKTRPCAIISPPEVHDYLDIVLAAPLTTGSRPAGYRVATTFNGQPAFILLEQIRALDKRRLRRRLGALDRRTLAEALAVLREMFAE
jgi:mRNA interferase MazF